MPKCHAVALRGLFRSNLIHLPKTEAPLCRAQANWHLLKMEVPVSWGWLRSLRQFWVHCSGGGGGLYFSVRGTPTRALEGNLLTLSRRSSSCHPRSSSPSYPLRSSAWHRTATQTPGVGAQNPPPHPHPTPWIRHRKFLVNGTGGLKDNFIQHAIS